MKKQDRIKKKKIKRVVADAIKCASGDRKFVSIYQHYQGKIEEVVTVTPGVKSFSRHGIFTAIEPLVKSADDLHIVMSDDASHVNGFDIINSLIGNTLDILHGRVPDRYNHKFTPGKLYVYNVTFILALLSERYGMGFDLSGCDEKFLTSVSSVLITLRSTKVFSLTRMKTFGLTSTILRNCHEHNVDPRLIIVSV